MNTTYLLIPIILLALFSYLLFHLFVRYGILSVVLHRKIWNSILLITFLTTVSLGILLTIHVNYKLEMHRPRPDERDTHFRRVPIRNLQPRLRCMTDAQNKRFAESALCGAILKHQFNHT
jgi:hypothetical protein